jgi:hypothetical protein
MKRRKLPIVDANLIHPSIQAGDRIEVVLSDYDVRPGMTLTVRDRRLKLETFLVHSVRAGYVIVKPTRMTRLKRFLSRTVIGAGHWLPRLLRLASTTSGGREEDEDLEGRIEAAEDEERALIAGPRRADAELPEEMCDICGVHPGRFGGQCSDCDVITWVIDHPEDIGELGELIEMRRRHHPRRQPPPPLRSERARPGKKETEE